MRRAWLEVVPVGLAALVIPLRRNQQSADVKSASPPRWFVAGLRQSIRNLLGMHVNTGPIAHDGDQTDLRIWRPNAKQRDSDGSAQLFC